MLAMRRCTLLCGVVTLLCGNAQVPDATAVGARCGPDGDAALLKVSSICEASSAWQMLDVGSLRGALPVRAGSLSDYRLARLIRYSFYKNIAFSFTFFWYQFYNGWSGQASALC